MSLSQALNQFAQNLGRYPACEINGGFHSVLSDCRNSTYPCVSHNWLFSFVIRFMMVS